MKRNLRSFIALLLIIFNISIIFESNFISNWNNHNISVHSDDDTNKNNNAK